MRPGDVNAPIERQEDACHAGATPTTSAQHAPEGGEVLIAGAEHPTHNGEIARGVCSGEDVAHVEQAEEEHDLVAGNGNMIK